jgi:hypothetical protein
MVRAFHQKCIEIASLFGTPRYCYVGEVVRTLSRFAMLILVAAQTAPSNTSSITGIVARAGTAEALDQAVVSLIPSTNIAAPPNVETDAAGRFTFRNVPPGQYAIRVRREGYFGPLLHGESQPFVSRPITLNQGQSIQDVHIDLIPGATVSGRVFDERGVPVPGADVSAVRITYDYERRFLTPVRRRADERGGYRLYWLAPGEYYIRADLAPQMASEKTECPGPHTFLTRLISPPPSPSYWPEAQNEPLWILVSAPRPPSQLKEKSSEVFLIPRVEGSVLYHRIPRDVGNTSTRRRGRWAGVKRRRRSFTYYVNSLESRPGIFAARGCENRAEARI